MTFVWVTEGEDIGNNERYCMCSEQGTCRARGQHSNVSRGYHSLVVDWALAQGTRNVSYHAEAAQCLLNGRR